MWFPIICLCLYCTNPWTVTQSEVFGLQFHFDQSKVRSEIRVRDGRSKPIDVLSKQLNGSDDFDIVINEPYTVFKVNISLVMMLMVVLVHLSLCLVSPKNSNFIN